MRIEAERRMMRAWEARAPHEVEQLRDCCRIYCERAREADPNWKPKVALPLLLQFLGIDDEFTTIKPHCFMTVRLRQSDCIVDVYDKVKALKYGWLEGGEAVLEDFASHNPHFHLLLPRKVHKGNVIKQLANRFKVPKAFVDYKQSDCPEVYGKRQSYLRGVKQEKKAGKVAADVEHRNANNIPHLINF